jgi:hypothetical protein
MAHDDPPHKSIQQLIRDIKDKPRATIKKEIWKGLTPKEQERLGRAQLHRMIAAELSNPSQLEFTLDGEPYPIEDVPPEPLLRRGRRLIVAGKRLIERGEAYVEEAKARQDVRVHS